MPAAAGCCPTQPAVRLKVATRWAGRCQLARVACCRRRPASVSGCLRRWTAFCPRCWAPSQTSGTQQRTPSTVSSGSRRRRQQRGPGEQQAQPSSEQRISQITHIIPHPCALPLAPLLPCPAGMPPVVFIAMDRDAGMAARISGDARHLRDMGVPTATVRVAPRVVHPAFFSDRRWGGWRRCRQPGCLSGVVVCHCPLCLL